DSGNALGWGKRFGKLLQALVDLLEGVGAGGEKVFEGDAEISFENVVGAVTSFVGIEMIGGGYGVPALMLREVHRGVGNLDEFLRDRAVQGEAGDAEAGGDVLFPEEGIGGDPTAKLHGELAGVLHVGLGHENDELVAAVASDDIGAAAVLLEDVADALEAGVPFEVAVAIVDEFEAVELQGDR